MVLREEDWEELLFKIKDKECIPFIGAGASASWLPLGKDIATTWTKEYGYPLGDSHQLARIAQFLAIKEDNDMYLKNILNRLIKEKRHPHFLLGEHRNTPYDVLADLNLPIHILQIMINLWRQHLRVVEKILLVNSVDGIIL